MGISIARWNRIRAINHHHHHRRKYSAPLPVTVKILLVMIAYQFIFHAFPTLRPLLESFSIFTKLRIDLNDPAGLINLDRPIWRTIFHVRSLKRNRVTGSRIGGALVTGHFATSRDLHNRVRLSFPPLIQSCSKESKREKRERERKRKSNPSTCLFFLLFLLLFLSFSLSLPLSLSSVLKSGPVRGGSVTCRHRGCIIMRARAPCRFSACSVVPCIEMHT